MINTLKLEENEDINTEGEKDTEASKIWTDAQLLQLQKAVVANTGRKKLQVPGFHAIQGLRKARESGWSVKDQGPANAEKYGIKFWGDVAKMVTSVTINAFIRNSLDSMFLRNMESREFLMNHEFS